MARRPFDPAEHGWKRTEYRRGDVLDRASVDALVEGADVVVHLAFIIFGGREETRGSTSRARATCSRRRSPRARSGWSTRHRSRRTDFTTTTPTCSPRTSPPRGTRGLLLLGPEGRARGAAARTSWRARHRAIRLRPCIVGGPRRADAGRGLHRPDDARARVRRCGGRSTRRPVRPGAARHRRAVPARPPRRRRDRGPRGRARTGTPGTYNLAGDADDRRRRGPCARVARRARARGGVDALAELVSRAPLVPAQARWINALRKPVLMDTARPAAAALAARPRRRETRARRSRAPAPRGDRDTWSGRGYCLTIRSSGSRSG